LATATDASLADGKPVHLYDLTRSEYKDVPQLTCNWAADHCIKALSSEDPQHAILLKRVADNVEEYKQPTAIDDSLLHSASALIIIHNYFFLK